MIYAYMKQNVKHHHRKNIKRSAFNFVKISAETTKSL